MTRNEAVQILQNGADHVALAKAIGTLAHDDAAPLDDIALALPHGGFVAEQAALALYRRLGWKLPADRIRLIIDPETWANIIDLQSRANSPRAA